MVFRDELLLSVFLLLIFVINIEGRENHVEENKNIINTGLVFKNEYESSTKIRKNEQQAINRFQHQKEANDHPKSTSEREKEKADLLLEQYLENNERKHEIYIEALANEQIENEVELELALSTKYPQINEYPCQENDQLSHFILDSKDPKPNFIFMSATSRFYDASFWANLLSLHDEVVMPRVTEPNFFSFPWAARINSKMYQSIYDLEPRFKGKKVGDFSSSYLYHPLAARRIASQISPFEKNFKIVIVLENPITYAYYSYLEKRNLGLEELSFESVIRLELEDVVTLLESFRKCYGYLSCNPKMCLPPRNLTFHDIEGSPREIPDEIHLKDYLMTSYLFRSAYDDMVERWIKQFPKNVLVVSVDNLFSADSSINSLFNFLGLSNLSNEQLRKVQSLRDEAAREWNEVINTDIYINSATFRALAQLFSPFIDRLASMIPKGFQFHKPEFKNAPSFEDVMKSIQ